MFVELIFSSLTFAVFCRKETSNNNEETYVYNGKYWEAKENNFAGIEFVELW